MLKKVSLLLLTIGAVSFSQAEPWKGNVDLGWTTNSGNSESTSLNGHLALENENDAWKHALNLKGNGNTSETDGVDETTAEKYSAEWKSDRKLGDRHYLFGVLNYADDRFSGYDFESNAAIGYGYKVIAEENKTLLFELGPGYRNNLLSVDNRAGQSAHIEEFTYRIGQGFDWKFSETSELKQYITFDGGSDLSTIKFGAYVLSKLSEALSLKVGFDQTQRSGDAQDDAEAAAALAGGELDDTDTTTYANISYGF